MDANESQVLGHGFYFEDMPVGFQFHSKGRTLTEADLNAFVNLTWFTEEMFVNNHDTAGRAIPGRPVPAGLVFTFAEGLIHISMEGTGLAFLNMTYDVKKPIFIGDTIKVFVTVIEARLTSAGDRGLVRTENQVKNQHGDTVLVYSPLRLVRLRPQG
jgi:acyl dehydratase